MMLTFLFPAKSSHTENGRRKNPGADSPDLCRDVDSVGFSGRQIALRAFAPRFPISATSRALGLVVRR